MADQSDVEAALAAIVGAAVYPSGLDRPAAVPGLVCRVYRGWPTPAALEADLAAGHVNISVVAAPGAATVTTRYPDEWTVPNPVVPTLTVHVVGPQVTFAGNAAPGQLAALLVDGRAAVHRTEAADTPASVAAALAGNLRSLGAVPWNGASASGETVSVPNARAIIARVVADQAAVRETRRQRQRFAVTCWCADPQTRDAVGGIMDAAMSAIDFLGLADGSSGRLRYEDSVSSDRWEDATLYRRELTYSVDYATTITAILPCLLVQGRQISPNGQTPITTFLS